MKKYIIPFLLAAISVSAPLFGKSSYSQVAYSTSSSEGSSGTTKTLHVTFDARPWKVPSSSDAITISPDGKTMTATANVLANEQMTISVRPFLLEATDPTIGPATMMSLTVKPDNSSDDYSLAILNTFMTFSETPYSDSVAPQYTIQNSCYKCVTPASGTIDLTCTLTSDASPRTRIFHFHGIVTPDSSASSAPTK